MIRKPALPELSRLICVHIYIYIYMQYYNVLYHSTISYSILNYRPGCGLEEAYMYIYIYICICMHIYIYIYIYNIVQAAVLKKRKEHELKAADRLFEAPDRASYIIIIIVTGFARPPTEQASRQAFRGPRQSKLHYY